MAVPLKGLSQQLALTFEAPEPTAVLTVTKNDFAISETTLTQSRTWEEAGFRSPYPWLTARGNVAYEFSVEMAVNKDVNDRLARPGRKRCKIVYSPDGVTTGSPNWTWNALVTREYRFTRDNVARVTATFLQDSAVVKGTHA